MREWNVWMDILSSHPFEMNPFIYILCIENEVNDWYGKTGTSFFFPLCLLALFLLLRLLFAQFGDVDLLLALHHRFRQQLKHIVQMGVDLMRVSRKEFCGLVCQQGSDLSRWSRFKLTLSQLNSSMGRTRVNSSLTFLPWRSEKTSLRPSPMRYMVMSRRKMTLKGNMSKKMPRFIGSFS